jgi:small redox-active disulfide protein 2
MLIEILGSGCPKCFELERRARQAVKQAGVEAEVAHVTDVRAIAERGVLRTPALAIDREIALAGSVPSVPELVALLINHLAAAERAAGPDNPSSAVDG